MFAVPLPVTPVLLAATAVVVLFSHADAPRQPGVASVTLSKGSVVGGTSVSADVVLDAPAGGLGQVVTLSYSSTTGLGSAPKSVTVPGGLRSAKVSVTTAPVSSTVTITIAASIATSTKGAVLTVTRPTLSSAALSRSSVQGGDSLSLLVTLDGNAPTGGTVMSLSFVPPIMGLLPPPGQTFVGCSSTQMLAGECRSLWSEPVPQSLTFVEGSRQLQLSLITPAVRQTRTVSVNASLGSARSLPLEIRQPRVTLLEYRTDCHGPRVASVTSPGAVFGVVETTDRVSDDGAFATLTSSSPTILVPPTVELTETTRSGGLTGSGSPGLSLTTPSIKRWGCFRVSVVARPPQSQAAVTATAGGASRTTSLTVLP